MSSLSSISITSAPEQFKSDAGRLPHWFHSDFERRLIGGNVLWWILSNGSNIIVSPFGCQYSNGLAEHTWRTLIQMTRAFIAEKQVGRKFWYFVVRHAAMMLNQVPGRLDLKLTTPFEHVHKYKPDSKRYFDLFCIRYFNHETDNAESCYKLQAHTLDEIAVDRDDRSNSIIFYNPITSSYCSPPDFWLDESRLPITDFQNSLRFDGGLTCSLLRNKTNPIHEPFPPGTHVSIQHDDAPDVATSRIFQFQYHQIRNVQCLHPHNIRTTTLYHKIHKSHSRMVFFQTLGLLLINHMTTSSMIV